MSTSPIPFSPNPRLAACSLPEQMRAGDVLNFQVQTALVAGSTVGFFLNSVINRVPTRITIAQVTIDANLVATFAIPSTTTGAWLPGRYDWACFAWDTNGDRVQLAQGTLVIQPDLGGTAVVDPRTQNQRILDNIKCLLEGRSYDDSVMYKIGGRELTKLSPKDLLYWEAMYASKVRRERIRRGERVRTNTIGVTFGGRY